MKLDNIRFEKYFLQLNGNYSTLTLTLFHFMDSIRMKLKIYFTVYVQTIFNKVENLI